MKNPNARKEGESFEKYRARRKAQAAALKRYLKGRLLWVSVLVDMRTGLPMKGGSGTYIRARHGDL